MNNSIRQNIDTHILDLLQVEKSIHCISYDAMTTKDIIENIKNFCKLIEYTKKQLYEYASEEEKKYQSIPKYLKEAGHADIYQTSANSLYKASSMLNINELQNFIQELKIGNKPTLYVSFFEVIKVLMASQWDE